MKFHEDPFLQRLTLVCVCGYVIMNAILTLFVLFCERGVLFWGEFYQEEEEEDDAKKKSKTSNSNNSLVGHQVCARIHHVRYSPVDVKSL